VGFKRTYSYSASNISWFLPVIMNSDADQSKSSNIPWNGNKEESTNKPLQTLETSATQRPIWDLYWSARAQRDLQKPTHAKATTWKTSHSHMSSFNNRNVTSETAIWWKSIPLHHVRSHSRLLLTMNAAQRMPNNNNRAFCNNVQHSKQKVVPVNELNKNYPHK
jgi:hypothetical protein